MKLTIDLRQDALMAHLSAYPERLATSVVRALNRITIMMQARVKEKLSGEVLHVRTGTLRRSINREVRDGGAGVIEGIVGTNVEYAAVHEYGFHGTVAVRAHVRELRERGRMRLFKNKRSEFGTWKMVRGKKTGLATMVTGRSSASHLYLRTGESIFLRHMNIPERSFLRSTLKEYLPVAQVELQRALLEAFRP